MTEAQYVQKFKRLTEIGLEINSVLASTTALDTVAAHIAELVGAERSLFLLWNMEGSDLDAVQPYGFRFENGRTITLAEIDEGISGWVRRIGKPTLVENAQTDPRNTGMAFKSAMKYGTGPLIVVPLTIQERVVGTLTAVNGVGKPRFTPQDMDLLMMLADQVARVLENKQFYEASERRRCQLAALDQASRHLRAEKETPKLLQEILRLAVELIDYEVGGLFLTMPQLNQLTLSVTHHLPKDFVGSLFGYGEGLVGEAAQMGLIQVKEDYCCWPGRKPSLDRYQLKTAVALPLKQSTGEIDAVCFLATRCANKVLSESDLEVLERFAMQAAMAYRTSRLMSREQRMFGQLMVLNRISDYIQASRDLDKILHVILTGVTASYGLGFNRAALLLTDDDQKELVGHFGIGHVEPEKAHQDWQRDWEKGLDGFEPYLARLERGELPRTPISDRVCALTIDLASTHGMLFAEILENGRCYLLTAEQFPHLPACFTAAFEPESELIVVPLMARAQAIGLLIADNKFTGSPITAEDIESLNTFANTAAVAIDNIRLFQSSETARRRLRDSYIAGSTLVSRGAPEQILQAIVRQAQAAAKAMWATLLLIDQIGQVRKRISTYQSGNTDVVQSSVRNNGLSAQVMRTGKREVIENTLAAAPRLNKSMLARGVGSAVCLPLSLQGQRIGVMWLHFAEPRPFSEGELDAHQLYVNQAAVAYDSARLIEELRHMRQAAEALAKAARLSDVLQQIVESAKQVLQADSTFIWSYSPDHGRFMSEHSVASAAIPHQWWQELLNTGPRVEGTAFTVLRWGWVPVQDITDLEEYPFLGGATQRLLSRIKARSFQGIALGTEAEPLGVLYVNYNRRRYFSDEERETAVTFAYHATLALRKAKLYEQRSQARDTAISVAKITTLENLNATLKLVAKETAKVIGCDAVTVYAYDPIQQKLSRQPQTYGLNYPDRVLQLPKVHPRSLVQKMLKRSKPLFVADVAQDTVFAATRFVQDEQIKSCMVIPLLAANEKVGLLFASFRHLHRFPDEKSADLELFAAQTAVAIRNAQLYEHNQRRLSQLNALHEASQAIQQSLDIDHILQQIAKQAWLLMQTARDQAIYSLLAIRDGQTLQFKAAYPTPWLKKLKQDVGYIDLEHDKPIGIVGRTLKTGEPKMLGNAPEDPDYLLVDQKTKSQITIPLKRGREVFGVFSVEHSEADAFDNEDLQTLQALATQAAIALENAELFEQKEESTRLLESAAKVARDASLNLPHIDTLLKDTVRHISERFGFYHTGVFLPDSSGKYAVLAATHPPRIADAPFSIGHKLRVGEQGIVGHVMDVGHYYQTTDVRTDPHHFKNPSLPHTEMEIVFPLRAHGQMVGAIDLQSDQQKQLSDTDLAVLQTMADQLASVIHNAQLYQEATQRLEEANALQDVAVSLTGEVELEKILNKVMHAAMKLTNTDGGNILLWEAASQKFTKTLKVNSIEESLAPYESQANTSNGLATAIMRLRKPITIPDVSQIEDFTPTFAKEGFKSSIGVPLRIRDHRDAVIGVFYVRSKKVRDFTMRQAELLEALASQAAAAVDRTTQYNSLRKLKGYVGVHTALDWMQMVSQSWGHNIRREGSTALVQIANLQRENLSPKGREKLTQLEKTIQTINEMPILAPLSVEETTHHINLNDVIRAYLKPLQKHPDYQDVRFLLRLSSELDRVLNVWASEAWIKRGLELVVDNAVWAMRSQTKKQILVKTEVTDEGTLAITISDNGPGIPKEVQAQLFKQAIPKGNGDRGSGVGLMLAETIFSTYKGSICVKESSEEGTKMLITLPLYKNHHKEM